MQRLDANTILVPGNGVAAEVAARAAAEAEGKVFVSPYSDFDVIAGQGTVALEMNEQCEKLAAIYVCVGGGGLISGIGSYLRACQPQADIIGCWAENAPAMHLCLQRGEIYDTPESPTLSDGSAGGIEPGAITFPLCQQLIDRQLLVSETEIAAAMRDMASAERHIIEGAAGVALAAALKSASDYPGGNIAVVVCGRNISLESFRSVICQQAKH